MACSEAMVIAMRGMVSRGVSRAIVARRLGITGKTVWRYTEDLPNPASLTMRLERAKLRDRATRSQQIIDRCNAATGAA